MPRRADSPVELAALLEQARAASPDRRIELRDAAAAHGAAAIEGVRPWLGDEVLAAFAVRVIERAGLGGEPDLAATVLRAARASVQRPVAEDIAGALSRLRAAASPAPAPPPAAPPRAPRATARPAPSRPSPSRRRGI